MVSCCKLPRRGDCSWRLAALASSESPLGECSGWLRALVAKSTPRECSDWPVALVTKSTPRECSGWWVDALVAESTPRDARVLGLASCSGDKVHTARVLGLDTNKRG